MMPLLIVFIRLSISLDVERCGAGLTGVHLIVVEHTDSETDLEQTRNYGHHHSPPFTRQASWKRTAANLGKNDPSIPLDVFGYACASS